jgi:hypothetical protein
VRQSSSPSRPTTPTRPVLGIPRVSPPGQPCASSPVTGHRSALPSGSFHGQSLPACQTAPKFPETPGSPGQIISPRGPGDFSSAAGGPRQRREFRVCTSAVRHAIRRRRMPCSARNWRGPSKPKLACN